MFLEITHPIWFKFLIYIIYDAFIFVFLLVPFYIKRYNRRSIMFITLQTILPPTLMTVLIEIFYQIFYNHFRSFFRSLHLFIFAGLLMLCHFFILRRLIHRKSFVKKFRDDVELKYWYSWFLIVVLQMIQAIWRTLELTDFLEAMKWLALWEIRYYLIGVGIILLTLSLKPFKKLMLWIKELSPEVRYTFLVIYFVIVFLFRISSGQ